jgi:uncharacterized protein with PIN domain
VTLLDAYALIALLADEPAAAEVEEILRTGEARVIVVNLAEAVDICRRVHDLSSDDIRTALEPLLLGSVLSAVVSDERQAWLAAELRAKHYNSKTAALSLADCFLLAHAITDGGPIATPDPPIAAAARAEEVEVLALPDSSGERA